jgi:hypothetical protein
MIAPGKMIAGGGSTGMPEDEVTMLSLSEGIAELLIQRVANVADGTLIVLPAQLGPPGGHYRDFLLTSVKELRTAGVVAEFLHPADQRTGLSQFSTDLVFTFAVGVAQNMTWDAAKAVWRYLRAHAASLANGREAPLVRLDVARVRRPGLEIDGLSLTAPASDSNAERFIRLLVGDTVDDEPGVEPEDDSQ